MEHLELLKYIDHLENKLGKKSNPKTYGMAQEGLLDWITGGKAKDVNAEASKLKDEQRHELEEEKAAEQRLRSLDVSKMTGTLEVRGLLSLFENTRRLDEACGNLHTLANALIHVFDKLVKDVTTIVNVVDVDVDKVNLEEMASKLKEARRSMRPPQISKWRLVKTSSDGGSDRYASFVDSTGILYVRTTFPTFDPTSIAELLCVPTIREIGTNITYHARHGQFTINTDAEKTKGRILDLFSAVELLSVKVFEIEEDLLQMLLRAERRIKPAAQQELNDADRNKGTRYAELANACYSLFEDNCSLVSNLEVELLHVIRGIASGFASLAK